MIQVIASYPSLLQQEEQVTKTPFDVMVWWNYLIQIDAVLLESDNDHDHEHPPPVLIPEQETNKHHSAAAAAKTTSTASTSSASSSSSSSSFLLLHALRFWIGQRACSNLPGSYKLWKCHVEYLLEHQTTLYSRGLIQTALELALIRLHSYPKWWLLYLDFVHDQQQYYYHNVTEWRHLVNRCFMALPVAQHDKIWPTVLTVALQQLPNQHAAKVMLLSSSSSLTTTSTTTTTTSVPTATSWTLPSATILALVKRYVQLHPLVGTEPLAELYLQYGHYGPAALVYQDLLQPTSSSSSRTTFTRSSANSSRHEIWTKFCHVCTQHPREIVQVGIDFDAMIRSILLQVQNKSPAQDSTTASSTTTDIATTTTATSSSEQQEMQGTLWIYLAQYYLHQGELDMARTILGQALEEVQKVRDFSLVFEAYMQLEETVLDALMMKEDDDDDDDENDEEDEEDENERDEDSEKKKRPAITFKQTNNEDDDPDWDILLGDVGTTTTNTTSLSQDLELELALARAEYITSRRPLLLNQVLLKQNPHNVGNWLQRADLLLLAQQQQHSAHSSDNAASLQQANVGAATAALEEALRRVSARQATNGQPSQLVLRLASLYEHDTLPTAKGLEHARQLFRRICEQQDYLFQKVEDLAECYVAWVEMELRQEQWEDALSVVRQSVSPMSATTLAMTPSLDAPRVKLARALTKSLRLWDLWLDLEESLGTVQTTKDAYYQAIEQKVATPLHILNFATFLLEHSYFEEAFAVYERGIDLFAFPHASAKLLWKAYLEAFVKHFQGTKLARARDLWTRCLESCPAQECAEFYLLCGEFEEDHGLTQRALNVYHQMCDKVPTTAAKLTAFQLYIAKTTQYVGLTATRTIYQEAIAALAPDDEAAATKLCLEFTKMETSLQEIDRARAILVYGAQFADPRRRSEYWQAWNEFEILHGNEETFREMLRIRKSVEAMYSTINYNAAEMSASSTMANLTDEQALNMIASQEGVELPSSMVNTSAPPPASAVQGFVKASNKRPAVAEELGDVEERVAKLRKVTAQVIAEAAKGHDEGKAADDAEIDIDDDDDEEDGVEEDDNGGNEDNPTALASTSPATDKKEVRNVITKAVPTTVFGSLVSAPTEVNDVNTAASTTELSDTNSKPAIGALERLRAAAKTTAATKSGSR
jgi:pre-mRNA-splicing factor SYF1